MPTEIVQGYASITKVPADIQREWFDASLIFGKITLNSPVHILRNGAEIFNGNICLMGEGEYSKLTKIDHISDKEISRKGSGNYYSGGKFAVNFDKVLPLEYGDIIESYVVKTSNASMYERRPQGIAELNFLDLDYIGDKTPYREAIVLYGKITMNSLIRILRKGRNIFSGNIASMRLGEWREIDCVEYGGDPTFNISIDKKAKLEDGDIIVAYAAE